MAKPKNIADYIKTAAPQAKDHLKEIYTILKEVAPDAVQSLKWSMPAFSYKRILFTFAGFKNHIGFYPTPAVITAFENELAKYVYAKGSVQFPHDKSLPSKLIKKMAKYRVAQSLEQDGKWKV